MARNFEDGIIDLLSAAGFSDAREVEHAQHRLGRVTFVQATRPRPAGRSGMVASHPSR